MAWAIDACGGFLQKSAKKDPAQRLPCRIASKKGGSSGVGDRASRSVKQYFPAHGGEFYTRLRTIPQGCRGILIISCRQRQKPSGM